MQVIILTVYLVVSCETALMWRTISNMTLAPLFNIFQLGHYLGYDPLVVVSMMVIAITLYLTNSSR